MTLRTPLVSPAAAGCHVPVDRHQRAGKSTPAGAGSFRIWYKLPMHFDAAHPLVPIASLAAGVFLLIAPRIVSVAVAVYLIIVGILGLNGIYHFFK